MCNMGNKAHNEKSDATTERCVKTAIESGPRALWIGWHQGHTELWHLATHSGRHVPLTDARTPPNRGHGCRDRGDGRGDGRLRRGGFVVG